MKREQGKEKRTSFSCFSRMASSFVMRDMPVPWPSDTMGPLFFLVFFLPLPRDRGLSWSTRKSECCGEEISVW